MIFDDDGYIRRAYTYIEDDDVIYKSFAFQIAERMMDNPEVLYDNPSVIEIAYTGKSGDFETIPMSGVLNGTVSAGYFADSIVLIGAYEEGMLDSYHVPIDHSKAMYGVSCQCGLCAGWTEEDSISSCMDRSNPGCIHSGRLWDYSTKAQGASVRMHFVRCACNVSFGGIAVVPVNRL